MDSHGPQGVECDGDPVRWMGESFARASSSFRAVASGEEDSHEDGARDSPWSVAAHVIGESGQSQKSQSRIVSFGPGRECREGANSRSVAACQGGQPACASQPRYHLGEKNYSFGALQANCFGINFKL